VTCPAGAVCNAGACGCSLAGQMLCGSGCVDTNTSTANCGARRGRQPPRELGPAQHIHHRDVFGRQVVDHRHRLHPRRLRAVQVAPPRPRVALGVAAHARARRRQRTHEVLRAAVHELRAGLDHGGPARQPLRVDPAAQPRPRLQNDDAQPGAHEAMRRLQPGGAGADDDHVRVPRSSTAHAGTMRAAMRIDNGIPPS